MKNSNFYSINNSFSKMESKREEDTDNIIKFGSYRAKIEYDKEDNIFVGTVLDIKDTVAFHSDTHKGIQEAFEKAINNYIEMLKEYKQ